MTFSGTERDARRNFVIGPNFGGNLSEILILGFRRGFQMPILGFRSRFFVAILNFRV